MRRRLAAPPQATGISEAAAITIPDEHWTERPLGCVVLEPGALPDGQQLAKWLLPRVTKWWILGEYAFVAQIPRTENLDKNQLYDS